MAKKKKKLKEPESMEECSFYSNRILEDDTKIISWVFEGQNTVNVKYTCGECGFEGEITQKYEKPITFHCQDCGQKIEATSLRKKSKKKKKKKK